MSAWRIVALIAAAVLVASLGVVLLGRGSTVTEEQSSLRVDRCLDRLLSRAEPVVEEDEAKLRDYARRTYCRPFDRHGWVYGDGALSIRAHEWLEAGHSEEEECMSARAGEPAQTVPCEAPGPETTIDCALLHHVRRSEVHTYLARLQAKRRVECDDGTALTDLGVA